MAEKVRSESCEMSPTTSSVYGTESSVDGMTGSSGQRVNSRCFDAHPENHFGDRKPDDFVSTDAETQRRLGRPLHQPAEADMFKFKFKLIY